VFEAAAATALNAAKAMVTKKLAAWFLALIPVVVVVWVVGAMLLAMMFMGGQQQQPVQGSGGANGCTVAAPVGLGGTGLNGVQLRNAATIIAVGKRLKVPPLGWAVAIAVALQESGMLALNFGDRDSLGMMQQRAPWGTVTQRMDVATSSAMFFQGGHGGQPGLLSLAGWQQMPVTVAAQSVQQSAFPSAYAAHEAVALRLSGAPAMSSAVCAGSNATTGEATVYAAAGRYLGAPYAWGGGGTSGPSAGLTGGAAGFDCSGLTQYAWAQAGVALPRVTDAQAAATPHLPPGAVLQAGDLLFFHAPSDPAGSYHHVGLSDGAGAMIHAPHPGAVVEVVHDVLKDPYYKSQFALATRPQSTTTTNR
jgi:cell wall-associated NlpC family hydrolase